MTQWPCSDSINLGRSPFARPSTELTWRAKHGARTRLSVEWKCLLSPWSVWHSLGTNVFNLLDYLTIKKCPKSFEPQLAPVIHVNPGSAYEMKPQLQFCEQYQCAKKCATCTSGRKKALPSTFQTFLLWVWAAFVAINQPSCVSPNMFTNTNSIYGSTTTPQ